jgi:hypothetical protein
MPLRLSGNGRWLERLNDPEETGGVGSFTRHRFEMLVTSLPHLSQGTA